MIETMTRRWAVILSSPEQLGSIPAEQVELSTRRDGVDGSHFLMYRDSLTAYKAANHAGAVVLAGNLTGEDGPGGACAMRLESGELLRLLVPRASARPPAAHLS